MTRAPNFEKIKKSYQDAENANATLDLVYDKMGIEIRNAFCNKNNVLQVQNLDTGWGKDKAFNVAMGFLTDSNRNPYFKKNDNFSKDIGDAISLRTMGFFPDQFKNTINQYGSGILNIFDEMKKTDELKKMKESLLFQPFAKNLKNSHIDDVLSAIGPVGATYSKKPNTIDQLYPYVNEYLRLDGRLGEGQMKGYL